jgi:acetyl esterase/lipase
MKTNRSFSLATTLITASVLVLSTANNLQGAEKKSLADYKPDRMEVYKKVGEVELKMHIFEPDKEGSRSKTPAIVFFFGGGWVGGNPSQFYPHCRHLAKRGMLAMAAEYRTKNTHGTTPFQCVEDGKSAVRWIRKNAERLEIDPLKIAAGGGSAGGHVATATATLPGLDSDSDSVVNPSPNALVLFNPVYDNGPQGYGYERVKDRYKEISPIHNIGKGMPPAIVFLGTKDKLIPVETGKKFKAKMEKAGSRSELFLYQDQPHGFFNLNKSGGKYYRETVSEMDQFLKSLGYFKN